MKDATRGLNNHLLMAEELLRGQDRTRNTDARDSPLFDLCQTSAGLEAIMKHSQQTKRKADEHPAKMSEIPGTKTTVQGSDQAGTSGGGGESPDYIKFETGMTDVATK